jgi:hypothetical protein
MVILAMLYGCGQEASTPVERAEKPHGLDKQEPKVAELAPERPASEAAANLPESNITSLQDEEQEMIERACKDWDSKYMGQPPAFCEPAGLSPAFCHSASRASFCK